MIGQAGRPASALEAVTDLLDLHPARPGQARADSARLGVVAGRRGPRFLVPLDHPAAAPASCLAYLGLRDARTRLNRGAVGLALKTPLARVVVREELTAAAGDGSLIRFLDELLHDPDEPPGLAVAVGLGHADEVWKPTLQVFRPDGTPAAFVKVGLGPVGDRLVGTEADTLAAWRDHADPRLVVPGLVADTTWQGLRVVVVAPLPADARRLPPGVPSAWAVRHLDGPPTTTPIATAAWWQDIRASGAEGADAPRVDQLLDRVERRHGRRDGTWARWHGDWVPWNLARCHLGLVAWDWEYSEPGAPVGLDEVHGAYQQARVAAGRSIADALRAAREAAHRLSSEDHSPAGRDELSAQAGIPSTRHQRWDGTWLTDAHASMLLARSARLEHLLGDPPSDRDELLAAVDATIGPMP